MHSACRSTDPCLQLQLSDLQQQKVGQKCPGWTCCLPELLMAQISHFSINLQTTICLQRNGCCLLVTRLPVNCSNKQIKRSAQAEANRTEDLHLNIIKCLSEVQFISGRRFKSPWVDESWAISGVAENQPWLIALLRDRKVWGASCSANLGGRAGE